MNSKQLLGDAMPKGGKRVFFNILMIIATSFATFGSVWALKDAKLGNFPMGQIGLVILVILFLLGLFGFLSKSRKPL
jgi:hypothetical protein